MQNIQKPSIRSLNLPHTTKAQTYEPRHVPTLRYIESGVATPDHRIYTRMDNGYLVRHKLAA